jgi:hypothetical protein
MTGRKTRPARSSPRLDYSAPALEKGMDIIELLAAADSGLTVSEISQRLDRRMSELRTAALRRKPCRGPRLR